MLDHSIKLAYVKVHSILINVKLRSLLILGLKTQKNTGICLSNVPVLNTLTSLSTFEKYFNNPDSPFFNVDEDIVYVNERYEQSEFSIMFDELN